MEEMCDLFQIVVICVVLGKSIHTRIEVVKFTVCGVVVINLHLILPQAALYHPRNKDMQQRQTIIHHCMVQ